MIPGGLPPPDRGVNGGREPPQGQAGGLGRGGRGPPRITYSCQFLAPMFSDLSAIMCVMRVVGAGPGPAPCTSSLTPKVLVGRELPMIKRVVWGAATAQGSLTPAKFVVLMFSGFPQAQIAGEDQAVDFRLGTNEVQA